MTTPSLKERLFKRQKGRCWICCKPMLKEPGSALSVTVDHVVPLGSSGANRPGNKLLAHEHCNRVRGNRPIRGVKLPLIIARAISRIDVAVRREQRS